jgi:hypothetical protein
MLAVIDLTHRQANRVLEQALRTRAQVELEPRRGDRSLLGQLAGREEGLLRVDLHDYGQDWTLTALTGAFCDVKAILSGQLYLFCSCIVTVAESTVPQRLLLSVPDMIQVANRRRFDRYALPQPPRIDVMIDGAEAGLPGLLCEVGLGGLGCELPRREADDRLLIDDVVRVRFELPNVGLPLELSASVCIKAAGTDEGHLRVGLEFQIPPPGHADEPAYQRLRQALGSQQFRAS